MSRHLTWENFRESYVIPRNAGYYSLSGVPEIKLYITNDAAKLGIKVESDPDIELPALGFSYLEINFVYEEGKYFLDFSISESDLYHHFYSVICVIADSVQLNGRTPISSIHEAVEQLRLMLSTVSLLGLDKVIGLWGELYILKTLLKKYGSKAVYYWKGADRSVHDFRYKKIELEIKTTRSDKRCHIISSLTQLDASPGYVLYICSLQVAESGTSGQSLPEIVRNIAKYLHSDIDALEYFYSKLKKEGFKQKDERYYKDKYYLRSEPLLVEIKDDSPKINTNLIESKFGLSMTQLISDVHYRLDVSGLGINKRKYDDVL